MSKNNKKTRKRILILLIVVVFVGAAGSFAYAKARDYAAEQLVSGLVSEMTAESAAKGDASVTLEAEAIYDALSPQEKDTVNEIIENHVSLENAKTVQGLLAENDTQGLREFVSDTLTADEISQVEELYKKYRDGE